MNALSDRNQWLSTFAYLAIVLSASVPASADAIFATAAPTLTYTENVSALNTVGTFTDSDSNLQASDFSVNIDWGDGTGVTAGLITSNGVGFDVQASHLYAEDGNYGPQLTFLSSGGGTESALDVANVLDAALNGSALLSLSPVEGSSLSGLLGSFQDENTLASPADFTVNIDWGDGTNSIGSVVPQGGGQFDINGNHTYAEEGNYTISASVIDTGGSTLNMSGSANVSDAALSGNGNGFAASAGVSYHGLVATFGDNDPSGLSSDFATSIDWGDGTITPGTIVASGGLFQVVGTHTYLGTGIFPVMTQANDIGGANTTLSASANVTSPASVPEPASLILAAAGLAIMLGKKWHRVRNASRSEF